ncbi:unnamed protein product, partial [Didymodactylos carnosus]
MTTSESLFLENSLRRLSQFIKEAEKYEQQTKQQQQEIKISSPVKIVREYLEESNEISSIDDTVEQFQNFDEFFETKKHLYKTWSIYDEDNEQFLKNKQKLFKQLNTQ